MGPQHFNRWCCLYIFMSGNSCRIEFFLETDLEWWLEVFFSTLGYVWCLPRAQTTSEAFWDPFKHWRHPGTLVNKKAICGFYLRLELPPKLPSSPGEISEDMCLLPSLKLTFSHLKMDGWNTFSFPFRKPYLRGRTVSSGSVSWEDWRIPKNSETFQKVFQLSFWSKEWCFLRYITLSPIIMEVDHHPKWKETNIGGTHFPLLWLWEEGYIGVLFFPVTLAATTE